MVHFAAEWSTYECDGQAMRGTPRQRSHGWRPRCLDKVVTIVYLRWPCHESLVISTRCEEAAKVGDGRNNFELQANGQVKLGRDGQYCLSQHGFTAGRTNVALRAAASASSTADAVSHGANMAVDGRASTFWASNLGDNTLVDLTIDFGALVKLQSAEVKWQYPAKAFSILLAEDGVHFAEAYATDANVLNTTRVPLALKRAAKAKVRSRLDYTFTYTLKRSLPYKENGQVATRSVMSKEIQDSKWL